jgi:hypothetical protein
MLGIKAKLSTAHHPQTDGQTEVANAEMERYLRSYVDFNQENWANLLPSAEFAANAAVSESTQLSPFVATRVYQPRMSFDEAELAETARERVALTTARNLAEPMEKAWAWAQDRLQKA